MHNQLGVLEFIQQHNGKLPDQANVNWAAKYGNLCLLMWLQENGGLIPDIDGILSAKENDQLAVLEWLYKALGEKSDHSQTALEELCVLLRSSIDYVKTQRLEVAEKIEAQKRNCLDVIQALVRSSKTYNELTSGTSSHYYARREALIRTKK